jgi:hypothetical protein
MLGIDHQHGRLGEVEPGTDPGAVGGQLRAAVPKPRTAPSYTRGWARLCDTPTKESSAARARGWYGVMIQGIDYVGP